MAQQAPGIAAPAVGGDLIDLERMIRSVPADERESPKDLNLADTVRRYADATYAGGKRRLHCLIIAAARRHALTNAVEVARAAAARSGLKLTVETIERDKAGGTVPQIMRMLPRRQVLRIARRSGVARSVRLNHWLFTVAVLAGAVLIAAFVAFLTGKSNAAKAWGQPVPLLSGVLVAAGGMLGQWLRGYARLDPDRELMTKLARDIATAREDESREYDTFVEGMAAALAVVPSGQIRCFVVADFLRLNPTTRDVIEQYLIRYASADTAELWVVFDAYDDRTAAGMRTAVTHERQAHRNVRGEYEDYSVLGGEATNVFELQPLTHDQAVDLAASVPDRGLADALAKVFATQVGGPGQNPVGFATFELLYLLAIDALVSGGETMAIGQLVKSLSREDVHRSAVLKVLLRHTAKLVPGALTTRLMGIRTDFKLAIEARDTAGQIAFRVYPEVGAVLEQDWLKLGLSHPGLVHLFWAMYWYDVDRQSAREDVPRTDRLASHLVRLLTNSPTDFTREIGDQRIGGVVGVVFAALIDCASACLRQSLTHHVVDLLKVAKGILDDPEHFTAQRRRNLAQVAREACAVLGDDSLIGLVFDLAPLDPQWTEEGDGSLADSLSAVFLQSLGEQRDGIAGALQKADYLRPLGRYAQVRGAWLALAIEPFLLAGNSVLNAASRLAETNIAELATTSTQDVYEATERRPPDSWSGLSFSTASLALWCWAWSGDVSRRRLVPAVLIKPGAPPEAAPSHDESPADDPADAIATTLELAYVAASAVKKVRFGATPRTRRLNFVFDSLTEELLTTVAGAAIYVLSRWDVAGTPAAERLADIVRSTYAELGDAYRPAEADDGYRTTIRHLRKRMTLVQMTWQQLGFAQMADEMAIRAAQFATPLGRDENAVARALGDKLQRPGTLGLFANTVVAEHCMRGKELVAERLGHGVDRMLSGGVQPELGGQLALMVLGHAHSFEGDVRGVMDYLGRPALNGKTGTRLAQQLATVPDSALMEIALWLLNVAQRDYVDGPTVMSTLDQRTGVVEDDEQRRLLDDLKEFNECEWVIRRQEILDVTEQLDRWQDRRDNLLYPGILDLLVISQGYESDRLRGEIDYVLGRYPHYISFSRTISLAERVARKMAADRERFERDNRPLTAPVVVGALRGCYDALGWALDVDVQIDIIKLLRFLQPKGFPDFRARLDDLNKQKLEIEEQRNLPRLLALGHWALLFWDYWTMFSVYGLPGSDHGHAERASALGEHELERQRARLATARPRPIEMEAGRLVVSGGFVYDIGLLFKYKLRQDASLDAARKLYNDAAKQEIRQLYAMLHQLPTLPGAIQEILGRHHRQVEERLQTRS